MKPSTARLLTALFIGYVALTAVHITDVVNHEPYAFDAWNVSVDTGAKAPSIGRFFSFWHQQYVHSVCGNVQHQSADGHRPERY